MVLLEAGVALAQAALMGMAVAARLQAVKVDLRYPGMPLVVMVAALRGMALLVAWAAEAGVAAAPAPSLELAAMAA